MDKSYFIELLRKYLKGDATKEECQFFLDYYKLFDSEPDILSLLSENQKEELRNQISNGIWQGIALSQKQFNNNYGSRSWIKGITAAAILLIICSTGLYFLNQSPKQKNNVISRSTLINKNRLLRLPDGSTVIVSPGSKLNYPSSFEGLAKREVYLEGQAYFDIKHISSKPFIIHTGQFKTTVLGTAFNIKAYPTDAYITVTVTRGKVKVGNQHKTLNVIMPNQQITYNKWKADIIQETVDTHAYLALKEQDLLMDNVTVAEAAELLEARFKVSILINDELIRTKRFTTTFLKSESLKQILKSICEFNEVDYHYDEEKYSVILSSKDSN